jgi:hypothetical protein
VTRGAGSGVTVLGGRVCRAVLGGGRGVCAEISRWVGVVRGSEDRGRRPGGSARGGGPVGGVQPAAAGSVLSFSNAALSDSVHGQAAGRCSLPRRPENASRAAMCSSR